MAELVPVDHDPFADAGGAALQLVPVDHDPFADQPSVAADMAKSAVGGFGKGVSYMAGGPGDLQQLGQSVSGWLRDRLPDWDMHEPEFLKWMRARSADTAAHHDPLGLTQTGRGDVPGTYELPTSQQVRHQIETITGPFHEPESTAGKFVDTAASFVPAALMGGEGTVPQLFRQAIPRVIKQGVLPGVASEAAGQATEGTPLEPLARAGAAIATGGGAALASRPATAEKAIQRVLPGGIDQSHVTAAERLIQDAQRRGIALTWPEALSQVAGRPVLSDAMRMVESAPQSRDATQAFYANRPAQIARAAKGGPGIPGPGEIGNIGPNAAQPSYIGPQAAEAATQTVNGVRNAINRATKPMYDAAGQTLVPQAVHAAMIQDPLFMQALDAVRNNPAKASYIRGALSDRSVKVYDAVAKELEERGQNAAKPTNPDASQAVAAANSSLGGDIKNIAVAADRNAVGPFATNTPPGVGNYEHALAEQTRLRDRILNPLLAGPLGKIADAPTTKAAIDALFPSNPLPNSQREVSDAVRAMAQRNPIAAAQLIRAHAESVFNEAAQRNIPGENQMGGAKFAAQIAGNPQQRANLQAAIQALPGGQQRWQGFSRFLDILQATGTRQPKGSLTAFNEREMQRMSTGGQIATAAKHLGSPGEWWHIVHDAVGKWQLGNNLNQLADILTSPRSGPLLQKITQLPSSSHQAGAIAARLIAQSNAGAKSGDRLYVSPGQSPEQVNQPGQ